MGIAALLRNRRLAWSRVMGAVVLAAIAVGTGACSGEQPVAVPSVPSAPSSAPAADESTPAAPPSPVAPPAPAADAPMARSTPVRVRIPTIGVDSELMDLGLEDDGTMEVPPGGFPAGWYTGAPTPGELGPAIIAGHVDMTGPGVFYRLRDLEPEAEVTVTRADGTAAVFRVTRVEQFPKDAFPTDLVYGDIDLAGLRLITCGGSFDRKAGHYDDNIIAFAELVRRTQA